PAVMERSSCRRDRPWRQKRPARRWTTCSCGLLDVAAELITHRRQELALERRVTARAEALVERGRQHRNGHSLIDPRLNGPAPFAGIGYAARTLRERRIRHESAGGEVEEPRGDHAATPPNFRDVCHV